MDIPTFDYTSDSSSDDSGRTVAAPSLEEDPSKSSSELFLDSFFPFLPGLQSEAESVNAMVHTDPPISTGTPPTCYWVNSSQLIKLRVIFNEEIVELAGPWPCSITFDTNPFIESPLTLALDRNLTPPYTKWPFQLLQKSFCEFKHYYGVYVREIGFGEETICLRGGHKHLSEVTEQLIGLPFLRSIYFRVPAYFEIFYEARKKFCGRIINGLKPEHCPWLQSIRLGSYEWSILAQFHLDRSSIYPTEEARPDQN